MKKATRYPQLLWYSVISKAALFDALFEQAALGAGENPEEVDPEVADKKLREILEPVLLARGDPMPWGTMKYHRLLALGQAIGGTDGPEVRKSR